MNDLYIHQLETENKQLKKKYENAVADYEYEKCKNNQAIEYIKEKQELNKMFGNITLSKESQNELLEILGDKENE